MDKYDRLVNQVLFEDVSCRHKPFVELLVTDKCHRNLGTGLQGPAEEAQGFTGKLDKVTGGIRDALAAAGAVKEPCKRALLD